ncbi:MAG: isoprenyl transferase [Clostridia bacterium]|nr:isoprenyl transferase [Clostridia bacterium]
MTANNLPRHVAIIMDGNGRWAERRGIARALGHRKGVEALREVVRESSDLGIKVLTLFAFSTENWKRSAEEVGALMGLLLEFFDKETEALHRNRVKIRVLGDIAGLPDRQRDASIRAMRRTQNNDGLQLNIALNYGGRDELVRAVRSISEQIAAGTIAPCQIDEKTLSNALDTAGQPDVDLLIRPGGEARISNFLLFQSAYAEFLFPDTLWPDFSIDAYREALDAYAMRDRRFGGRGGEE